MEQFPNELSFECLASSRHLSYQGPHFTNTEWHIWPGTCTVWISWQSLCFCFPLFYLVLAISAVFRKCHTQVSQTLHFFKLYTVDHEDLHFFCLLVFTIILLVSNLISIPYGEGLKLTAAACHQTWYWRRRLPHCLPLMDMDVWCSWNISLIIFHVHVKQYRGQKTALVNTYHQWKEFPTWSLRSSLF